MDTGSALGGSGLALSMVGIIYSAINHKHIRSKCCGKELEISIDIDTIHPTSVAGASKNQIDLTKTIVDSVAIPIASAAITAAPLQKVAAVAQTKVKPILK